MRRRRTIVGVGLAAGVTLTASACGVQPTGVNIASNSPFSVSTPSGSQPASSAGGTIPVGVFLMPVNAGYPKQVTHYIDKRPSSPTDLLPALQGLTRDDLAANLTTYVDQDITLYPTTNAHEYTIADGEKPSALALLQITCTFDAYWREHPDNHNPSTRFLLPSGSVYRPWDDCSSLLDSEQVPAPTGPGRAVKPTAVAAPNPYGN